MTKMQAILFWAILIWMLGMLWLVLVSVREIWRENAKGQGEESPAPQDPGPQGS